MSDFAVYKNLFIFLGGLVMKKNNSLTTKGLFRHKVLVAAMTLGVMSGCLMAAPVYAEMIDDSQSFNSDTTIDGENGNAVYIYSGKNAVINITQGTLTLKNDGTHPAVAVEDASQLTFTGDKVSIENSNQEGIPEVIWVADSCKLNFNNAETRINGGGWAGLATGEDASISSKKLFITTVYNDEWHSGLELNNKSKFEGNGVVNINTVNGELLHGIYSDGAEFTFNNDLIIKNTGNEGTESNIGIQLIDNGGASKKFRAEKNVNIDLQGGKDGTGFYSTDTNDVQVNGDLKINVDCTPVVAQVGNKGLYITERSNFTGKTADITVSGEKGVAIYGHVNNSAVTNTKPTIIFTDDVKVNAEIAVFANSVKKNLDVAVVDLQKNFISEHDNSQISVDGNSIVKINSTGTGIVKFSGIMGVFVEGNIVDWDNYINFNMNNEQSYWKLTGNSYLDTLNIAHGAELDMTAEKNENKYSKLYVKKLTGDAASQNIIKMDIDASENADNSDRIYVKDTHEGVHYITLNNVAADASNNGAEGTVLVSVKNEQGEFKAKDSEGTLFWNKYDLAKYEKANGDTVTEGYNTDWYLKDIEKLNKPTTSVETVLAVNSLNYHTWRTENDKLLQRMGELRHNGEEEQGAWFRVKGSKIGYDGSFENKYTTYELGYDTVTKRTDDVVRYQGAALSYVDGKSSYSCGSGDNHGKSISFYTTEQYSKGHYLDFVFKISNMDNDFKVFDTKGNKITGEYDNTGVSISAEYGRKNDLNNGWYIEPQAQLTLGYMGGASYETDNGILVDQSGIKSALGRIGFNIGKKIGEKGIVYAKANLLHEFGGGYDVVMEAEDSSLPVSNTYNDTWFEYGLGVALATSKNSHVYFDVERSTGSDFYKDWQWNAGMRWNF